MTTAALQAVGQRDVSGRFLKGCVGGPGNPYVRQVARLRAALYEALTADDVAAVARAMVARALGGDVAAARLVLEYALGKPLAGTLASALDAEATRGPDLSVLTVEELRQAYHISRKLNGNWPTSA